MSLELNVGLHLDRVHFLLAVIYLYVSSDGTSYILRRSVTPGASNFVSGLNIARARYAPWTIRERNSGLRRQLVARVRLGHNRCLVRRRREDIIVYLPIVEGVVGRASSAAVRRRANQRRAYTGMRAWLPVVQVTSRLIGRWGGHQTHGVQWLCDCVVVRLSVLAMSDVVNDIIATWLMLRGSWWSRAAADAAAIVEVYARSRIARWSYTDTPVLCYRR